jgi:hypothetical protein
MTTQKALLDWKMAYCGVNSEKKEMAETFALGHITVEEALSSLLVDAIKDGTAVAESAHLEVAGFG